MLDLALNLLCLFIQGPAEYQVYLSKDQETIVGKIVRVEGERVRIRIPVLGGSAEVVRALGDFAPHSAYRILASVSPSDSSAAHLRLAEFAGRHDLTSVAMGELQQARKIAGDATLAAELEKEISERSLTSLRRLFSESFASDPERARRVLSEILLRHGDALTEREKEGLMADLANAEQRRRAEYIRVREAAADAATAARKRRALNVIVRHVELGRVANRQALLDSLDFSRAHEGFLTAADHFEEALLQAEALRAQESQTENGELPPPAREGQTRALTPAESLWREARAGFADALLNAASLCTVQTRFRQAYALVNRVLAIDPQNRSAHDMRARIEIASTRSMPIGRR